VEKWFTRQCPQEKNRKGTDRGTGMGRRPSDGLVISEVPGKLTLS